MTERDPWTDHAACADTLEDVAFVSGDEWTELELRARVVELQAECARLRQRLLRPASESLWTDNEWELVQRYG